MRRLAVLAKVDSGTLVRFDCFESYGDALIADFDELVSACPKLPDSKDAHVVAAAFKTKASMIVTENLADFPSDVLASLNIEAKSADAIHRRHS